MSANSVPPTYRANTNLDTPYTKNTLSTPSAVIHAARVPDLTSSASRTSETTSASVMSTDGRWRRLNARPTVAAVAACATTSRVTRRTGTGRPGPRAPSRRRQGRLPGSDALTAHLRAGHAPQAGAARVFGQPFTLTRLTPAAEAVQPGP